MASFFYTSDAGSLRRTWAPAVAWGTLVAALGVVIAAMPAQSAGFFVFLVGLGSVVGGLVWMSWTISLRRATGGWWAVTFAPGVLLLVFGVYALLRPETLTSFLFVVAGAIAAVWGFVDMAASWRWRSFFARWWLRLLRGMLVTGVGVVVFLQPGTGVVTTGVLIGVWLVVIGVTTVALGLTARRLPKSGGAAIVESDRRGMDHEGLPPA
jgi:uncharacterized membrane protein HdeD (DUF308 family)